MLKHASLGLLFFRNGLTARIVCISTSSSVRVVIRVVSGLLVVSIVILLLGLIVVVIVVGIEFLLIHVLLLRLLLRGLWLLGLRLHEGGTVLLRVSTRPTRIQIRI